MRKSKRIEPKRTIYQLSTKRFYFSCLLVAYRFLVRVFQFDFRLGAMIRDAYAAATPPPLDRGFLLTMVT